MKWFTATNEGSLEDDHFFELLATAVLSAKKNTSLDPHLLYEGNPQHERVRWLEQKGVTIVPHELSFRNEIETFCEKNGYGKEKARIRSGAYLRSELPVALIEENFDDTFVLYTDCDVLFVKNPKIKEIRPKHFAACGSWEGGYTKFNFGGFKHYNTGVMLMNIKNMHKKADKFKDFVLNDGYEVDRPKSDYWQDHLILHDQTAYNLFYDGYIEDLRTEYNWNPSNGYNKDAFIVHFYGPKWNEIEEFRRRSLDKVNSVSDKFEKMYRKSDGAYDYYRNVAHDIMSDFCFPISS